MKVPIRAVTICVGYDDILSLTLPYNQGHFAEHWIITTPEDVKTQGVALANSCRVHRTREFYYKGAEFAKWRALEIALDVIGRDGWTLLLDADICWPKDATEMLELWGQHPQVGCLYCPNRRMLEHPTHLAAIREFGIPEHWTDFPLHPGVSEWAGYSLLVNGADPILPKPYWHDINWRSCGGADSFLQALWPHHKKVKLPFEVLHIGSTSLNWYGRTTPYLDGRPDDPEAGDRRRKVDGLAEERKRTGFAKERIE